MEESTPTPEKIEDQIQRLKETHFLNKKAKIQQDKLLAKYTRLSRAMNNGTLSIKNQEEFLEEIEDGIAELKSEKTSPNAETNLSETRALIRNNQIETALNNLLKGKIFPTKSKRNLEKAFTKYKRLRRNNSMGIISIEDHEKMMAEVIETILENHL